MTEFPDNATPEDTAHFKPCPFCGEPLLNRPEGPFNPLGQAPNHREAAMHYSPDCFLHSLSVTKGEIKWGLQKRWDARA